VRKEVRNEEVVQLSRSFKRDRNPTQKLLSVLLPRRRPESPQIWKKSEDLGTGLGCMAKIKRRKAVKGTIK
jgi:hypothetical protein